MDKQYKTHFKFWMIKQTSKNLQIETKRNNFCKNFFDKYLGTKLINQYELQSLFLQQLIVSKYTGNDDSYIDREFVANSIYFLTHKTMVAISIILILMKCIYYFLRVAF